VAADDEKDTGQVVTMMDGNGKRGVPENREKLSFRLGQKRQRVKPSHKHGGAFELLTKQGENSLSIECISSASNLVMNIILI
jgi:transcription initiation factor TFIID subunit 8